MAIPWAFNGPQILRRQVHEGEGGHVTQDTWPRTHQVSQACGTQVPANWGLGKEAKSSLAANFKCDQSQRIRKAWTNEMTGLLSPAREGFFKLELHKIGRVPTCFNWLQGSWKNKLPRDWKPARGITALLLGLFAQLWIICVRPRVWILKVVMNFKSCVCDIVDCWASYWSSQILKWMFN